MIMRISLLIAVLLFTVYAGSEPVTIKIKPSEIFEGFPQASPTAAPQSLHESESPSSDTQSTPIAREIISSPDTPPGQSDQPTSAPRNKTHFFLDNKALEEYIKNHPEPYVQSVQPTPAPDIEELREQLIATPTPTPVSDVISCSIPVNVQKMNDKWDQLDADFVINYQIKKLYSYLSLKGIEDNKECVTVLKNSPSLESFPLKKGRYQITGTFWLPDAPDLEIKTVMGALIIDNRMRYTIILDRNMEQDIMREIGLRNAEKLKALEDKSPVDTNLPEGW
jgi:hypothetical protein